MQNTVTEIEAAKILRNEKVRELYRDVEQLKYEVSNLRDQANAAKLNAMQRPEKPAVQKILLTEALATGVAFGLGFCLGPIIGIVIFWLLFGYAMFYGS